MSDGLTIVRHGSGDDVWLEVEAVRAPLFFRAGVHTGEAHCRGQAAALRAFLAQPAIPRFTLLFGTEDYQHLHADLLVLPQGQVEVAVRLQDNFGDTARPRLDRCTLHFDTDVASVDRFAAALAGIMADGAHEAKLAVR